MINSYNESFEPTSQGCFDIPEEDYHRIKALNNSSMKVMADLSALHMKKKMEGYHIGAPITSQQKAAMEFGTAVDLAVFEPKRFKSEVVGASHNRNTVKFKAWAEEHTGKLILPMSAYARARDAAAGITKKKAALALLELGYAQKSLLWKHPVYGFWCKARVDWISATQADPILCDLKTTKTADWKDFKWVVRKLRYYWQAYWYLQGMSILSGQKFKDWRWIVVETYQPHESIVYKADRIEIAAAGEKIEALCQEYAKCLETDVWPGYPDEVIDLGDGEIDAEVL